MTLQVALTHRTSYRYDRPVILGPQVIRLRPAPHTRTPILSYALKVEPDGHFLNWQQDPQGNLLARVVFPDRVERFEVTVDLLADMATINPFDFFLEAEAERWPFAYGALLDAELLAFRTPLPAGPLLRELVAAVSRDTRPTVPMLVALNARLRDRVDYVVRLEPGVWSAEETLAQGRGSCRDSAWLLVQLARHLGLAARFVSGYLIQLGRDLDTPEDAPQAAPADFADLHAWAEIYLPGAGWIGFDATSGLLAGEGHIPLAASPEPASAAAISGLVGPCETRFEFAVGVSRIVDTPRGTAPYGDATWQAIMQRGEAVDRLLAACDVRLTMGCRPSFALAGPEAEQCDDIAPGPTGRRQAGRLIRRLAALWSPGAVLQHSVATHDHGESLPRPAPLPWTLRAHWREDGVAVWQNQALLAADDDEDDASAADALHFVRALAVRLRLDPERVLPGDGSTGFGLALRSLSPLAADAAEAARDPLGTVPATLDVQCRDGLLHVFLPPRRALQEWLDLVAAIEATSAEAGRRVILEGHAPPRDPRLQSVSAAPGPGVIEIRMPASASWSQQVQRTRQLYEAARHADLAAETFMIDGRHVGTGGGNHLVMGGARPSDSPFRRRPDLLKSLLGFWHNHPSLSYLFAGLFIGPAGPSPRTDETRQDGIAELEIALAQIRPEPQGPPWLVDRVLRNLLADITGDNHRSEFRIDRLHPPQDEGGRLGLVELRALEMPPHPQMAAAQALLLRAAVAGFWQTPYERRLVRWGSRLHDDFMLPHYVHEDLLDALQDLAGSGIRLEADFFAPHHAFRFPLIGSATLRGIELALHQALEPWPVLGGATRPADGTMRRVDRSVERLQVRVRGWDAERYVLGCNGIGVPLAATARAGEHVAGVRFKAREPVLCLHPTLPAQAPLTFDVFDRWSGRSIGGLTHHVRHPGGRSYETRPVNANEAEARRRERFQPFGHTPGSMQEPRLEPGPELPRTLDLRRAAMAAPATARSKL